VNESPLLKRRLTSVYLIPFIAVNVGAGSSFILLMWPQDIKSKERKSKKTGGKNFIGLKLKKIFRYQTEQPGFGHDDLWLLSYAGL
jgi:hypothetical protein